MLSSLGALLPAPPTLAALLCCSAVSSFQSDSRIPSHQHRALLRLSSQNGHAELQTEGLASTAAATLGAWVPIGSKSALGPLCPTRVEVMGLDLVVWDDDDRWSVLHDVCPHRLAPLSQGRVDRNANPNCIECPYHGWQYDADGKLTKIPQMEPANLSSALVDKASAQSYPVHVTGDLIWAFLPSSVHGESFPQELLPEDYYCNGLRRDCIDSETNFAVLELPASYDFFLENAMDPSHLAFAHHGVLGSREDAGPLKIDLIPSNFTHVSMKAEYTRKGESRTRIYGIQRPFSFFTLERSNDGWRPGAVAFFVPIREGKVRFISSLGNNKLSKLPLPTWIIHLLTLKLTEGDSILHDTEREARRASNDTETARYITPTAADRGVLAYRKWWREHGLSDAPPHTFGSAPADELRPIPRHEYTNTWQTHTKSCSHCRAALRKAKWLRKWSVVAGVSAALGASSLRRPMASVLAGLFGVLLSSVGNKMVLMLEGKPRSDTPDRPVPLD